MNNGKMTAWKAQIDLTNDMTAVLEIIEALSIPHHKKNSRAARQYQQLITYANNRFNYLFQTKMALDNFEQAERLWKKMSPYNLRKHS